MKPIFFFMLLLVPALACVNNSLYLGIGVCSNCTNITSQYVCFDWSSAITSGILNNTWYNGMISDAPNTNQTNKGYCYNNLATNQLCTTNTTYKYDWAYNLTSISSVMTTFSPCTFTASGWWNFSWFIRTPINVTTTITQARNPDYRWINVSGLIIPSTNAANEIRVTRCNELSPTCAGEVEIPFQLNRTDNSTWAEILFPINLTAGITNWRLYNVYSSFLGPGTPPAPNYPDQVVMNNAGGETAFTIMGTGFAGSVHNHAGVISNLTYNGAALMTSGYGVGSAYNGTAWVFSDSGTTSSCSLIADGPIFAEVACTTAGTSISRINFKFYGNVPRVSYDEKLASGPWFNDLSDLLNAHIASPPSYTSNITGNGAMPAGGAWTAELHQSINGGLSLWNVSTAFMFGEVWNTSSLTSNVATTFYSNNPTLMRVGRNSTVTCSILSANTLQMQTGIFADGIGNITLNNTYQRFMNPVILATGTRINSTTSSPFTNYTVFQPTITQQNGYYNICYYDEETDLAWNMNNITNGTLAAVCSTSVDYLNITNSTCTQAITNEPPLWFKAEGNITGEVYSRTIVPSCTWPCVENIRMYFVNLNNKVLVQLTAFLNDLVGGFGESVIKFSHPIVATNRQINSMIFDGEGKTLQYLIKDQYYTTCITKSDKSETRCLGFIVIDATTTKIFTINPIDTSGQNQQTQVIWNLHQNGTHLVFSYNDTSGSTTSILWNVYNGTKPTQLLYTHNETNTSLIQFTYVVPANQTYYSTWTANTGFGTLQGNTTTLINLAKKILDLGFTADASIVYDIACVLLMFTVSVMFGPASGTAVVLMISLLFALLQLIGWWSTSNATLDALIIGTCVTLSLINLYASTRNSQ